MACEARPAFVLGNWGSRALVHGANQGGEGVEGDLKFEEIVIMRERGQRGEGKGKEGKGGVRFDEGCILGTSSQGAGKMANGSEKYLGPIRESRRTKRHLHQRPRPPRERASRES